LAADLDRGADQCLLAVLAAAFEPVFVASQQELVDLDLARQQATLGRDHRAPQLLQDQPRGLIARQRQLALQLLGRDPRMMRGDQVGRPEPRPQRRVRSVHHRPGGHPPATDTPPDTPGTQPPTRNGLGTP
jgi:hypothetical protein